MGRSHGIAAFVAAGLMAVAGVAAAQTSLPTPSANPTMTPPEAPPPATTPEVTPPPEAAPPVEVTPNEAVPNELAPTPLPPPPPAPPQTYLTPFNAEQPTAYGVHNGRFIPSTGFGASISAGGGGGDYTSGTIKANTGTTGVWNIRAVIGTRTYLGFEGAYTGGASSINGLGLAANNTLVRNGLEALARIQYPVALHLWMIEPYIFGGIGWDYYSFRSNPTFTTASFFANDNTLVVPAGAGFSFGYMGFIGDVRAAYRPTFEENLFGQNVGLTNWNAQASIGYEF